MNPPREDIDIPRFDPNKSLALGGGFNILRAVIEYCPLVIKDMERELSALDARKTQLQNDLERLHKLVAAAQ